MPLNCLARESVFKQSSIFMQKPGTENTREAFKKNRKELNIRGNRRLYLLIGTSAHRLVPVKSDTFSFSASRKLQEKQSAAFSLLLKGWHLSTCT